MDIIFIETHMLQQEFRYAVYFWALIIFIFGILLCTKTKSFTIYLLSCLALYLLAIVICYSVIFSQFTQAKITRQDIILNYIGLSDSKQVTIFRKDVVDVYELPDGYNYRCEIRIITDSGERYKSVSFKAKSNKCKEIVQKFK